MIPASKFVCFVIAALGIITIGVCIWVINVPVKMKILQPDFVIRDWNGENPPKIGIATAIFMMLIGIYACFENIEERFIRFMVALFLLLTLATAFMSIAIKDHLDWKKVEAVQNIHISFGSSSYGNSGFVRSPQNSFPANIVDEKFLNSALARLRILAVVGGIDMVTSLIALVVFYVKRPRSSSKNVKQTERTS